MGMSGLVAMTSTTMYNKIMRTIKNFPNYEVSEEGIIYNITTGNPIKPVIKNGYMGVRLSRDGIVTYKSLHRIVYETYKGKIPKRLHVDHINGIRTDNRLKNLRLLTPEENNKNRNFLVRGSKVNTSKLNDEIVVEIRKAKMNGERSLNLAQKYGVTKGTINRIAKGDSWTHLPVYDVDNSVWSNPKLTGGISGKTLRDKYGSEYFSQIGSKKKFKKHCNTCKCLEPI